MAKILFINPLQDRHGSTYRARNLAKLLEQDNSVCYVEPGQRAGCTNITVTSKEGVAGLLESSVDYLRICRAAQFDVLYLQKPMIMTLPALFAARGRGKAVIIDFDDMDSGWQVSNWKRAVARFGEMVMPRCADMVTTHNAFLQTEIRAISGRDSIIVPQGVNGELFNPGRFDRNEQRARLGLPGKIVFCFLGSFTKGSAADLDLILAAFALIRDRIHDRAHDNVGEAVLMIVGGGGPLEDRYRKMIGRLGLAERVVITGRRPQEEIPSYLACADYGLVLMRDNQANRCRVSLKLLEYLAMDLTVIGHVVGSSREAFDHCCIGCEPTAKSLSSKLLDVIKSCEKRSGSRDYVLRHHDWIRFAPLMNLLIDRLMNQVNSH